LAAVGVVVVVVVCGDSEIIFEQPVAANARRQAIGKIFI
jgi:hypothetical protein